MNTQGPSYEAVTVKQRYAFDKVLISMAGCIGELFLFVKGYFASKNRGWRYDWEKEAPRRPDPHRVAPESGAVSDWIHGIIA